MHRCKLIFSCYYKLSHYLSPSYNDISAFFQSLVEFEAEYERRGRAEGYNTITHGIRLYDGMWALAFALNKTMTMVESAEISGTGCEDTYGSLVPLHMFNYSNEMMGCLIQWNLQRTNFSGVTVCLHDHLMYIHVCHDRLISTNKPYTGKCKI